MRANPSRWLSTLLLVAGAQAGLPDPDVVIAWPQFRGPRASGVADGPPPPTEWSVATGHQVLWHTPVPGLAHSSPIVWNQCVIVATAVKPGSAELKVGLYGNTDSVAEMEPHQWRLMAFSTVDGAPLWNTEGRHAVPSQRRHTKSTQCNATPATDGRYLVAILGSEGLFCFDLEGHPLWYRDLGAQDAGPYTDSHEQWGFASSPVIHQHRVIVQCDVASAQFLVAFDLKTGQELWRTARQEVSTWSTPTLAESHGRTQIVLNGWRHLGGYDLETGRELWRLSGGGDAPIPTPVIAHGLAYLTSSHGRHRPMRAIRLDAIGDITPQNIEATNAAIAWVHPRQGNYLQTPIVVGGLLYGCTDYGLVTCFDARTGRIHYSERLRGAPQGFTASPVAAGGHLYFTGEQGDVFVVPATDRFSVLATNSLGETCLATPAIAGGRLFFRTRHHLVAIGNDD
jgi:outer membrane protein assembly factor BamB